MKRVIVILLVLTVVIGVTVAGYWYNRPVKPTSLAEDPTIEKVLVKRETLISSVDASGRIEPKTEVQMKFETGGIVAEVLVKPGQPITAGTVLARLEASDLEFEARRAGIDLAQQEAELTKLYEPPLAEKVASARLDIEQARAKLADLQDGPDQDEVTKAAADLRRKEVALKEAQWAYDQVSYRGDVGAMAEANALQTATIDYEAALADYNLAVKEPTRTEIIEARAQVAQAEASLADLLKQPSAAEIATLRAAIDKARLDLDEKQRNLAKAILIAPIDGVVTEVNIEPGERALNEEADAAIILADTTVYLLKVEVDEMDIGRVKLGQPVVVTLDAMPDEELAGTVADIAPRPTKQADSSAIVTYEVTISLTQDNSRLLTGMTANAAIEVDRLQQVVVVPNRAIKVEQGEKPTVYVEKLDGQGNLARVEVELGLQSGDVTQVVAGLAEGDEVIVRNPPALTGAAPSL